MNKLITYSQDTSQKINQELLGQMSQFALSTCLVSSTVSRERVTMPSDRIEFN